MTSTIKVNNVQNQCGQNIINENSNTITLGASGDTIALASGASQTGFGRTGTVAWVTTIQTSTPFTAVSGKGYFINTTSGAITMNLPSSPSAGDIVAIKDYAGTFGSNNLTIGRGGSNMNGDATDSTRTTNNESLTMVYADATKGWLSIEEGSGFIGEGFITATGGTTSTCGNYKFHTFTGPGTFTVSSTASCSGNNKVDYLVVAGGGSATGAAGSGGGAGGFRMSNDTCMSAPQTSPLASPTGITISAQAYPITIGAGGSRPEPNATCAPAGSASIFSTITSAGGAGGTGQATAGQNGGSGSGGGGEGPGVSGGTGNTPPVSPPQGQNGGVGGTAPSGRGAGGGGGAGGTGQGASSPGGDGGVGSYAVSSGFAGCNGTTGPVSGARYFAGGGGGGFEANSGHNGEGGDGGGGDAGPGPGTSPGDGQPGTTNTGGGAGGGSRGAPGTNSAQKGGNGGSGIVILRYKYQ